MVWLIKCLNPIWPHKHEVSMSNIDYVIFITAAGYLVAGDDMNLKSFKFIYSKGHWQHIGQNRKVTFFESLQLNQAVFVIDGIDRQSKRSPVLFMGFFYAKNKDHEKHQVFKKSLKLFSIDYFKYKLGRFNGLINQSLINSG